MKMHTPKEKPHCFKDNAKPYQWRRNSGETEFKGEYVTKCGNDNMEEHLILNPMCKGCDRLF